MTTVLALSFSVLASFIIDVDALTLEEVMKIESDFSEHLYKCQGEFSVTDDEIKAIRSKQDVENIDPCYFACVYKSSELLNDDGLFDADVFISYSDKYLSNDEDKARFGEIANKCAEVNEQEVTDGKDGCDRAKLILECFASHRDEVIMSLEQGE